MGFQTCSIHGLRYEDYGECAMCQDERIAEESMARQEKLAEEQLELQRRRADEEGVCDCCGQRFVERTRVRKPTGKEWTGVLARYAQAGVCPACANRYDAF